MSRSGWFARTCAEISVRRLRQSGGHSGGIGLAKWDAHRPERWWRLVRGKKIDRAAVLRNLQTIEDDDYDGFVL